MSSAMPPTAPSIVRNQFDAYNARDIERFTQCWASDCRYYEFPDRLLASGMAEVRERHVVRFKETNLFGKLIKRIAVGNLVIDQEIVTRTFPEGAGEIDVVAIYVVRDGKIEKAWFNFGERRLHARDAKSEPRPCKML